MSEESRRELNRRKQSVKDDDNIINILTDAHHVLCIVDYVIIVMN